jgi:ATP-dependent RNA helicase RhlE
VRPAIRSPAEEGRFQNMSFHDFDLHPALARAVGDLGFTEATPIQRKALPPGLAGRDVLACAMTGSGKTAAFLLPILQRLAGGNGNGHRAAGTRALVLTPTRELAAQVHQHLVELGRHVSVRSATVFGGVGQNPQERALRAGVDVVVATPGRLLDLMGQGHARFDGIEVLVLDEADRMLDMGFLPDVQRIVDALPRARQTMLFSATLPPPIVQLARRLLDDPARLDVERPAAPATGVTQEVMPVPQNAKPRLLIELLRRGEIETALVFTRTKHRANRLAEKLEKAGVAAARIHGNRSQSQRELALADFKAGRLAVLVATDIASRGIDIEALPHVVNFDVPGQPEDYIHRVGRTARARQTGHAVTFAAPDEAGELAAIERAVGKRLPRRRLEGFDYEAATGERFEIPVGERIAEIRARKAEDRARARAKAERKAQNEGARSGGQAAGQGAQRRSQGGGGAAGPRGDGRRGNESQREAAGRGGAPPRGRAPRAAGGHESRGFESHVEHRHADHRGGSHRAADPRGPGRPGEGSERGAAVPRGAAGLPAGWGTEPAARRGARSHPGRRPSGDGGTGGPRRGR